MPTGNIDPIITELAARRRELGIGPHQLSIRCGFPGSQIAMYESGARVPDVARLRRWARELGLAIRAEVSA
jgi:transcriptional regulator with XRE-family HTH domain